MAIPKHKHKPRSGRPKAFIDWDIVETLLEAGATCTGLASRFGVAKETFSNRCVTDKGIEFSAWRQQKIAHGNDSLREAQYKTALSGNPALLIWLGKNRLDQSDKTEVKQTVTIELQRVQSLIDARAKSRGVDFDEELQFFLDRFGDTVRPETREKLIAEKSVLGEAID